MIRQMDLLLILSEKARMADGEEVKREHLEGDRGVRRALDDTGGECKNTRNPVEIYDCVGRAEARAQIFEIRTAPDISRMCLFHVLFALITHDQKRQTVHFYLEAVALYTTLENSNFALTNPIIRGSFCFGV